MVGRLACLTLVVWSDVAGAQTVCEMRAPDGTLGLTWLECVTKGGCAVNEHDSRGWTHVFSVEPTIRALDPHGPAAGSLKVGDAIVEIDGYLITTAEGGRRLANTPTGTAVALRIRRQGRERTVTVVATPGCNEPGLNVSESRWPERDTTAHYQIAVVGGNPRFDGRSRGVTPDSRDTLSGQAARRSRSPAPADLARGARHDRRRLRATAFRLEAAPPRPARRAHRAPPRAGADRRLRAAA